MWQLGPPGGVRVPGDNKNKCVSGGDENVSIVSVCYWLFEVNEFRAVS